MVRKHLVGASEKTRRAKLNANERADYDDLEVISNKLLTKLSSLLPETIAGFSFPKYKKTKVKPSADRIPLFV